jgi:hypothetical protein
MNLDRFTVIGYDIANPEAINDFIASNLPNAQATQFGNITQHYLNDSVAGTELHFYSHMEKSFLGKEKRQVFCILPSFKGSTRQGVRNVQLMMPNKNCEACASLYLWVSKDGEEYPLIVALPNYFEIQNNDFSVINEVGTTLFPREFRYWKSEADFKSDTKNPMSKFAVKSFIPSGTFSPKDDPNFVLKAECICNGIIKSIEKKTNSTTNKKFYHFVVDTYAAEYDVVIHESFFDMEPEVNWIIGGVFWVCGKIIVEK